MVILGTFYFNIYHLINYFVTIAACKLIYTYHTILTGEIYTNGEKYPHTGLAKGLSLS